MVRKQGGMANGEEFRMREIRDISLESRVKGRLKRAKRLLLAVAIVAGFGYLGHTLVDDYLKDKYKRFPEEKSAVKKGIEALFESEERSKEFISEAYLEELKEEGYWKEIKGIGLVKDSIIVTITEGGGYKTATYSLKYLDKDGKTETVYGIFDLENREGKWVTTGE